MNIIFYLFLILAIMLFLYFENNHLQTNHLSIQSAKIPRAFTEFTIVHLSDLHNKQFGKNQRRIIAKIEELQPDVIFITGDIIDRRRYNPRVSLQLIERLSVTYPIYYVTGNHEGYSHHFEELQQQLQKYPIHILRNTATSLTKNGQTINILGLDDPSFFPEVPTLEGNQTQIEETIVERAIDKALEETDPSYYNLLLSHRPEFFASYVKKEIDIVFCGHAHGGQIRIPRIGGILAPSQGFFPRYTEGLHQQQDTHMVISRGLGNSLFPQRLFNKPEIVVVTLQAK